MENSRELKEIGESFSALKRYTVLSGQEDVEDAVIEQGISLYSKTRGHSAPSTTSGRSVRARA